MNIFFHIFVITKNYKDMKKLLLLVCVAFVAIAVDAQGVLGKREHMVSGQLGFGRGLAVEAKWEMGVLGDICQGKGGLGVGAVFGFSAYDDDGVDRNNMVIGAQSNFHYAFIPKLDTYAGLTLGYEIDPDGFYLGAQIGTRYFFNNHWALGAEFGYGVSFAKIGVTYKF